VSMPSLRLRTYTDAHLFETICQIRGGDELDGGTNELVHHIPLVKAKPDEHDLGSFTVLAAPYLGSLAVPRNGNSSTLTKEQIIFWCTLSYTWHHGVARFDSFKGIPRCIDQPRIRLFALCTPHRQTLTYQFDERCTPTGSPWKEVDRSFGYYH
jgi:hypothetical protein